MNIDFVPNQLRVSRHHTGRVTLLNKLDMVLVI